MAHAVLQVIQGTPCLQATVENACRRLCGLNCPSISASGDSLWTVREDSQDAPFPGGSGGGAGEQWTAGNGASHEILSGGPQIGIQGLYPGAGTATLLTLPPLRRTVRVR